MSFFKFTFLAFFIAAVFLFCPNFASAEEIIDSFDATIRMNSDASINISERIEYDFGDLQKHGITRTIPVRYKNAGGNYNLRISDISVSDGNGAPCDFSVESAGDGRLIKIGNSGKLVSGSKIYVISYKISRAITYFPDHDELYWDVVGDKWTVTIANASAQVIFPQPLPESGAKMRCFQGFLGSVSRCGSASYAYDDSRSRVIGEDFNARQLAAGSGFTIVAGISKGNIYQPTYWESKLDILRDNWILLMPIIVFAIMFLLWFIKGRDPRGRGTIIPEFDVPDNLTPAEVGTIIDEKCSQKEVSAEIINLAVKGYLRIRRVEGEKFFMKTSDYIFEKLKDGADLKDKHEADLMVGIFEEKKSVKFSECKKYFYAYYKSVAKDVYNSVSEKGYFPENLEDLRNRYIILSASLAFACFLLLPAASASGAYGFFSVIFSAFIAVCFAGYMPRKTYEGVIAKEHILGLKEYLSVAEKDRLEFHNAPEKNPRQFEYLLPYAIALGVEKQWAKQFEDIYCGNPSWYDDLNGNGNFSVVYFTNSLGNFTSDLSSSMMSASAANGASGFDTGGFSAGGFGGGGGGSW